ncbi:hypothetical protein [Patulibacter defluvii]|uniref:hypothetical protein n=1 Tax=Patulibacter defluvii TaxID=3095358 RepID=UPI002A74A2CA|nr:hypothetical protein [Patulibacter sp. DM4]
MPPDHDAFGRPARESSPTALRRTATDPASAPVPARAPRRPGGTRRAAGRIASLLGVLLLLAGGVAAVTATMRHAVAQADDDPAAVEHGLDRAPFGPRSLLRPGPLDAALGRLRDRLGSRDRILGVTITPMRLILAVVDGGGARGWLSTDATGAVDRTSPRTSDDGAGFPIEAIRPTAAARFLARKYRALRPGAREPMLGLTVWETSRNGGAPRRALTWTASLEGVGAGRRSWTLDGRGREIP